MTEKTDALLLASFAADALALGGHWVYNTHAIDRKYGRMERYHNPLTSYHTGKKAGDFTHYGDQTLVLMDSVAAAGRFDVMDFSQRWQQFFKGYGGYFDKATKTTLKNIESGLGPEQCGSSSDDLAGASRIAPLVYAYQQKPDQLIAAARSQTAMTHNNKAVIDAAEFFARSAVHVLDGKRPTEAIHAVVTDMGNPATLKDGVSQGLDSSAIETRQAIADFGQMCELEAALPGTIHLITKYEDDLQTALVENVMAGGDSSARGMLVGLVLGAHLGMASIPQVWLDELNAFDRINAFLHKDLH